MEVAPHPQKSFFVRVDCEAHSRFRDPQGVYTVSVLEEKSLAHCAYAAIQVVKDQVPFVDENLAKLTMRVFTPEGNEVVIPTILHTEYSDDGAYCGRAEDYPESITWQ